MSYMLYFYIFPPNRPRCATKIVNVLIYVLYVVFLYISSQSSKMCNRNCYDYGAGICDIVFIYFVLFYHIYIRNVTLLI